MVVLEKEEILERGHQLLKVKKQVFEFQCKLCRPGVPEEILVEAKNYIKPAHVDGVVEERSQHNLCDEKCGSLESWNRKKLRNKGYPCCAKRVLDNGKKKKFWVVAKERKVYGLDEIGQFCSLDCKRKCHYYKMQLSDEPLWATIEKKVGKEKVGKDLQEEESVVADARARRLEDELEVEEKGRGAAKKNSSAVLKEIGASSEVNLPFRSALEENDEEKPTTNLTSSTAAPSAYLTEKIKLQKNKVMDLPEGIEEKLGKIEIRENSGNVFTSRNVEERSLNVTVEAEKKSSSFPTVEDLLGPEVVEKIMNNGEFSTKELDSQCVKKIVRFSQDLKAHRKEEVAALLPTISELPDEEERCTRTVSAERRTTRTVLLEENDGIRVEEIIEEEGRNTTKSEKSSIDYEKREEEEKPLEGEEICASKEVDSEEKEKNAVAKTTSTGGENAASSSEETCSPEKTSTPLKKEEDETRTATPDTTTSSSSYLVEDDPENDLLSVYYPIGGVGLGAGNDAGSESEFSEMSEDDDDMMNFSKKSAMYPAKKVLMYLNHWVTDSTRAVVNKYRQRRSGVAESNVPEETAAKEDEAFKEEPTQEETVTKEEDHETKEEPSLPKKTKPKKKFRFDLAKEEMVARQLAHEAHTDDIEGRILPKLNSSQLRSGILLEFLNKFIAPARNDVMRYLHDVVGSLDLEGPLALPDSTQFKGKMMEFLCYYFVESAYNNCLEEEEEPIFAGTSSGASHKKILDEFNVNEIIQKEIMGIIS